MNYLQAIILGVVEGITEFLPISSTYHLIIASSILGLNQTDFVKLFEVFIQSGAILSVLLLYIKDVVKDKRLLILVGASFIPTAVVGLLLHKVIKNVFFETPLLMATVFIIAGIVFIVIEWLIKKEKIKLKLEIGDLTLKSAILIGLFQALAVVPGVSRAGAVIVTMMIMRYRRDDSAKYSFLLSIPTIFAASALDAFQMRGVMFANMHSFGLLLVGFITAFISSYFVVKWFIRYLQTNTLTIFGIYRLVVGGTVLLSLLLR